MASWREQAVARTVDPVRARAEKRVQGFLDAALELLAGESGKEFTVQEVVKQSGQSLRSFYQNFSGKHELLLALLEESVFKTAARLREAIAAEPDALGGCAASPSNTTGCAARRRGRAPRVPSRSSAWPSSPSSC